MGRGGLSHFLRQERGVNEGICINLVDAGKAYLVSRLEARSWGFGMDG